MASSLLVSSTESVSEDPKTPAMKAMDIADGYDWQHRAYHAEAELGVERAKVERERRRSQRFQNHIDEYVKALAKTVQDCSQMANHCQFLANTNNALLQKVQRGKSMIETLEAVILMLYKLSPNRDLDRRESQSGGNQEIREEQA